MSPRTRAATASFLASALIAGGAGTALAEPGGEGGGHGKAGDDRQPSKTSVQLGGLSGGSLTVSNKIEVDGTLRPFVKGQKITVLLNRGKKVIDREAVKVRPKRGSDAGQFSFSKRLVKQGRYSVQAIHDKNKTLGGSKDSTRNFRIRYPDLDPGSSGDVVKIFNELLAKQGYVNDEGSSYDSTTGRAVQAFHKVNKADSSENATQGDFETLANGKGGYDLEHPEGGKHVEVDLSRQVMVLANGKEVDEIYTISSGKASTPTIVGQFNFYRKEPGTNSHGMVNSVYYQGGYATHGYNSVPDYPASHGCVRSPIPDSLHIYDWIDIGDSIYIYR